jgi:hypothetical protein
MFEEFRDAVIKCINSIDEKDFTISKDSLIKQIKGTKKYKELYDLIDPYKRTDENDRISLKNLIKKLTGSYNLFQLKVSKRGKNIVNLVVIGDEIITVKNGNEDTVIPPFGYVVSIPKEDIPLGYDLEEDEFKKQLNKDFRFIPEIELENNKSVKLEDIDLAIGGVTLLPNSPEEVNEAMKDEKTHLISSRRGQETDFAMIDDKGPRQVIGVLEKDNQKYLAIITISGRMEKYYGIAGADFPSLIKKINEKLPVGYQLRGLINLDGGSSVSTSYFQDGKLYTINIPTSGPTSKVNQVRSVNSVFVINW